MPTPVAIHDFGHLTTGTTLPPEILDSASVEVLGTAGGRQFARAADGRELVIKGQISAWEADNPTGPGEVWVQRTEMVKPEGRPWPESHLVRIRARVVEVGSFDQARSRELTRQKEKERRASPRYELVDALVVIPELAAKLPEYHLTGPDNVLSGRETITIRGRSAIRGPRAIIEHYAAKGIRLQPTPDGSDVLVYAKSGRLDPRDREAIRASSRLLAGELTGNPVACELCRGKQREPAFTIAEVDVAVCERHASEAVPA